MGPGVVAVEEDNSTSFGKPSRRVVPSKRASSVSVGEEVTLTSGPLWSFFSEDAILVLFSLVRCDDDDNGLAFDDEEGAAPVCTVGVLS